MVKPKTLKGKIVKSFTNNADDGIIIIEFEDGSKLTIQTEFEVHYDRAKSGPKRLSETPAE